MLGFLPFSGVASAQTARDTDDACPADAPDAFTDDNNNVHEDNINCVAFWEIVRGTTATTYSPRTGTTRAQMASIIAQLIDTAAEGDGTALPADPPNAFTDDDTSVHHDNINRLAAAGVVNGTSPTTFTPQALVTRAQMASFIAQGIDYINDGDVDGDLPPEATQDHFGDDDTSVHEDNINRLAEQDIVVGTGPAASGTGAADHNGNFSPQSMVFRDQTASFAAQAADFLAEEGFWPNVPGVGNAVVLNGPELVRVEQESFSGGVLILRYIFDEPIEDILNGEFFIYPFDDTSDWDESEVEAVVTSNRTIVRAEFQGVTQAYLDRVTVATVEYNAVTDFDGIANPEANAPLKAANTSGDAATTGPDAIGIQNFRAEPGVSPDETDIDVLFDEAAWNLIAADSYILVLVDGETELACDFVSGNGTTTHTVRCPTLPGNVQLTDAHVARVYVIPDAVTDEADLTGNNNVTTAADSGNGTSSTPDLVAVEIDVANNRVTYDFDEQVFLGDGTDATGTPADFTVYLNDGTLFVGDTASTLASDRSKVVVQFSEDLTSTAVGGIVAEGAVIEREADGSDNLTDEERRASGTGTTVAAGTTNAPDLTAASEPVVSATNLQGQATQYMVILTFDENVTDCDDSSVWLWLQDGTRIQGTDVLACGVDATLNTTGAQFAVGFNVTPGTPPSPADALLAAVEFDAVEDASGQSSIEASKVLS